MNDKVLDVVPRLLVLILAFTGPSVAMAQSVCLPAPRLLTTMPMGGQVGTTLDVTITGESLEELDQLRFSHPAITATRKLADDGSPVANQYVVTIAADCPPGIHEARVMTRLGISSSRVFSVGALPETTATTPNTKLETALPIAIDSVCNGKMTAKAIDYYSFEGKQGQRIIVNCAARGIDSKLNPVLVVADAKGNDLRVERRGGSIDFTPEADGKYVIKVHDLTFDGGPYHFYRLTLQTIPADAPLPLFASTRDVNAFSWPPIGLAATAAMTEVEPNDKAEEIQKITLPCDIAGSFFPAADVDAYEFTAKMGEVWWVEVASDRLGRPTDPSIVVQQVNDKGEAVDLVELSDIPSPVKVSSNGYSYDGPCYNAGSADILGKVEIKQDGVHRLRITDLFGGTRNDPRNVYRLIIRKAEPDFAIVGWALHMNLRNGDRNALSKPMALRGGATMAFEVVVVRRDGFDGPIELGLDNLPAGVTAAGLTIPKGASRGILLLTADEKVEPGLTSANFFGRAEINGEMVTRQGSFASMTWPVKDQWQEIPTPRLLADVPVSACGAEAAPLTIAAAEEKVYEAKAGEKLTIPLTQIRRNEFSGAILNLQTFGPGFEGNAAFDVSLKDDATEAVVDLTKLKPQPGDYTIAFYGSAVAKYADHPQVAAVADAEEALAKAQAKAAEAANLAPEAPAVTEEEKKAAEVRAKEIADRQKKAAEAVVAAEKKLQTAQTQAAPKDIVDIVVSQPIQIRVVPAVEVTQK
ncbi:serine protease [Blastopirellula sp. JC732]|uniref:Serine protease n=1 Tax=Blastopirellula sediminis TaxID=2894196 RepID=A0A9X1MT68_9BACT|nr:serine protease [Blastopirellula sediminis]MCC9604562.1 serine protease [Blastopirellula sediminis]MCC9632139.1 serine protease [Blastopirellula sediminis]